MSRSGNIFLLMFLLGNLPLSLCTYLHYMLYISLVIVDVHDEHDSMNMVALCLNVSCIHFLIVFGLLTCCCFALCCSMESPTICVPLIRRSKRAAYIEHSVLCVEHSWATNPIIIINSLLAWLFCFGIIGIDCKALHHSMHHSMLLFQYCNYVCILKCVDCNPTLTVPFFLFPFIIVIKSGKYLIGSCKPYEFWTSVQLNTCQIIMKMCSVILCVLTQ